MNLEVMCKIHKNEKLHLLYFNTSKKVKKGGNKKGFKGFRIFTDWAICQKCNKPRKVKAGFA